MFLIYLWLYETKLYKSWPVRISKTISFISPQYSINRTNGTLHKDFSTLFLNASGDGDPTTTPGSLPTLYIPTVRKSFRGMLFKPIASLLIHHGLKEQISPFFELALYIWKPAFQFYTFVKEPGNVCSSRVLYNQYRKVEMKNDGSHCRLSTVSSKRNKSLEVSTKS